MTGTNNYNIQLPTVGGDTNVWGGFLNNGALAVIDAALGSSLAVSITSADVNLTTTQFQNAIFVCSGTLTGNRTLTVPLSVNSATLACGGRFVVVNNCAGNYTLTVKTVAAGSTGVVVPKGFAAFLYSDGTNVGYCTTGLPGYAQAVNGNPNGQLAGTAGSANTNASLAYDYTNLILYVCTTTGTTSTAVWTNVVSGSLPLPTPQGYLTLASSTNNPILASDTTGTVLYYTPFQGNWAAIHNGLQIIPYRFSQLSLTLSTSQAASNIYDVFLAYNTNSPVIGVGPSWAAGGGSVASGSSARGTGAGSTAIQRDSTTGLWVNVNSMSLIYNTGAGNTTITVAAGQGIFLGSIYIDSSAGQITCNRSIGQNRKWGVSNAYNAQPVSLQVQDPASTVGYTSAAWGVMGSSNNNAQVLHCLAERMTFADFMITGTEDVGSTTFGVGWSSTSAPSGKTDLCVQAQNISYEAMYNSPPALGLNTVYPLLLKSSGGTFTVQSANITVLEVNFSA